MRHLFSLLALCILLSTLHAQAPQGIPYQAVARTAQGDPVVNAPVQVRFSLREQTASGTISYQEAQSLTTNDLGLFATAFGTGTASVGTFSGINWAQSVKFLQVEIDLGQGWVDMGAQQLMSVPYALFAERVVSDISDGGVRIGYGQSGNWTCPNGITSITVELWGGGGGGQQNCPTPGARGGNGGYVKQLYNVTPGQTYTIIVGNGGATFPFNGDFVNCQYTATRGPGYDGGISSFDGVIVADGGGGGANGIAGADGAIINWQYSSAGTSGNVPYIPSTWVQNPPTGVALGGVGTSYCNYSFLACGATTGQQGYCIISY